MGTSLRVFVCCVVLTATAVLVTSSTTPGPLKLFGNGISGGVITVEETQLFHYELTDTAQWGVATHFWIAGEGKQVDDCLVSYYIDGEFTPSVQFTPALSCGVGDNVANAPWSNKWFGKGAATSAWFNSIRIPFQKDIRVTVKSQSGTIDMLWLQVRGVENYPLSIGGIPLPPSARMVLQKYVNPQVKPLERVPMASVPKGYSGLLFSTVLQVVSGTNHFLEGCIHSYNTWDTKFPGVLVATGTEDYFDSAWYFNGGEFHFPMSGLTNVADGSGFYSVSAYRIHEMDPIPFHDGFQFKWRNGDTVNPATHQKCLLETGGEMAAGKVTNSSVVTYAWVYMWPNA